MSVTWNAFEWALGLGFFVKNREIQRRMTNSVAVRANCHARSSVCRFYERRMHLEQLQQRNNTCLCNRNVNSQLLTPTTKLSHLPKDLTICQNSRVVWGTTFSFHLFFSNDTWILIFQPQPQPRPFVFRWITPNILGHIKHSKNHLAP